MSAPEFNRESFNVHALHKYAKSSFQKLIAACATTEFRFGHWERAFFKPFEGYRHPMRQHYLRADTKSTKAGPWESAHQYGLAVDFAISVNDKKTPEPGSLIWDEAAPWELLRELAAVHELEVPIDWDRGHVVSPLFTKFQSAMQEWEARGNL